MPRCPHVPDVLSSQAIHPVGKRMHVYSNFFISLVQPSSRIPPQTSSTSELGRTGMRRAGRWCSRRSERQSSSSSQTQQKIRCSLLPAPALLPGALCCSISKALPSSTIESPSQANTNPPGALRDRKQGNRKSAIHTCRTVKLFPGQL